MVASGHSPAGFVFLFFRFGRLAEGTGPILEEKIDNFFAAATRGLLRGTRVVNIAPGRYAGAPLCHPRVATAKKLSFFPSKIVSFPSPDSPRTKKTKKQESRKAGEQESRTAGK